MNERHTRRLTWGRAAALAGGSLRRALSCRRRALPLLALEGALARLDGAVALLRALAWYGGPLARSTGGGCRALLRTYGGVHAGCR